MTPQHGLQEALQYHQAGRYAEAESRYRQILSADPQNADALHLLGVLAHQVEKHQAAIDLIYAAIQRKPTDPNFFNNLGSACLAAGRYDDAIACYQRAVE